MKAVGRHEARRCESPLILTYLGATAGEIFLVGEPLIMIPIFTYMLMNVALSLWTEIGDSVFHSNSSHLSRHCSIISGPTIFGSVIAYHYTSATYYVSREFIYTGSNASNDQRPLTGQL